MKKEKVLFVRVTNDQFKKIADIASNEERTQVSVVRQAIKEFLKRRS